MASSRNLRAAVAAVALALLAGCTMQPRYERPMPPLAESWPTLAPDLEAGPAATDIGWQTFFNDERLRRLIAPGLANHRSEERRVGKGGVSTCRSRWAPYH